MLGRPAHVTLVPVIACSPHLSSSCLSPRPSQGSISQYLSDSGSGTAVLASARRALDEESSNCLFLLPRSLRVIRKTTCSSLQSYDVMLHGLYQQQPLSDGIEIYPHSQYKWRYRITSSFQKIPQTTSGSIQGCLWKMYTETQNRNYFLWMGNSWDLYR